MSIEVQIQLIVMSIMFGFIFMIFYSFMNEIFYKSKFRIIIELPFFLLSTIIYFYLLYIINDGFLNIYLILFIFIGVIIYYAFYYPYFLYRYVKIHKKLILILNKHVIIKIEKIRKKWKEKKKYGKKRSPTKLCVEQKQSNNNVITWIIDPSTSIHS